MCEYMCIIGQLFIDDPNVSLNCDVEFLCLMSGGHIYIYIHIYDTVMPFRWSWKIPKLRSLLLLACVGGYIVCFTHFCFGEQDILSWQVASVDILDN